MEFDLEKWREIQKKLKDIKSIKLDEFKGEASVILNDIFTKEGVKEPVGKADEVGDIMSGVTRLKDAKFASVEPTPEPTLEPQEPAAEPIEGGGDSEAKSAMIFDQLQFLLHLREKITEKEFQKRMDIFDKYSKGSEKGLSEEEISDREEFYSDWSNEDFDELISLVEKERVTHPRKHTACW